MTRRRSDSRTVYLPLANAYAPAGSAAPAPSMTPLPRGIQLDHVRDSIFGRLARLEVCPARRGEAGDTCGRRLGGPAGSGEGGRVLP
jgi:hypothetical protein